MASKAAIEVRLTLGEAKAIVRFANCLAELMDACTEPLDSEFLMERAIGSCKSGLAKMEALIAAAEPEFCSLSPAELGIGGLKWR